MKESIQIHKCYYICNKTEATISVHRAIKLITQLPSFYTFYKPDDDQTVSKNVGIFKNKSYSLCNKKSCVCIIYIVVIFKTQWGVLYQVNILS